MNNERILLRIQQIESQLSKISERLYDPNLEVSEAKELNKRKKKLIKDIRKLEKRYAHG